MRVLARDIQQFEGKIVNLAGWVNSKRDHGKIVFIDLRDFTGLVQVVFPENLYKQAHQLKEQWVVEIEGKVSLRPKGSENPKIPTGKYEIQAGKLRILNESSILPFPVNDSGYQVNEKNRLEYRYLDLRRERLQRNLRIRDKFITNLREFLHQKDFVEVETPILSKSTPEGARDFLIPSRLFWGKFFALPQSPQQYKQLLMVSGLERYFQVARCFRDEDTREDRQPEFTQLDIEASFMSVGEILDLVEKTILWAIRKVFPEKKITKIPFPRIDYDFALERYGSDKPDLRKNKSDKDELSFCFITDFPMFEWNKQLQKWDVVHHPFTLPQTDDVSYIKDHPERIAAYQYDLILNGQEVGGGSLRSFKQEILEAVFEVIGYPKEIIRYQFGHLLDAFSYGAPPHGGIAIGLDRLMAILLNEPSIREVIAFPKTGLAQDLMMKVPAEVRKSQLDELGIKIVKKSKSKKLNNQER